MVPYSDVIKRGLTPSYRIRQPDTFLGDGDKSGGG